MRITSGQAWHLHGVRLCSGIVPYDRHAIFLFFCLFLEWHRDEVGGLGDILYGCNGTLEWWWETACGYGYLVMCHECMS